MYCFEKNVLNTSQIFTFYEYFSITNVAKKVAHASIMPQSTKRVKNLKFNCDPIQVPFPMPPHILVGIHNRQVCIPALYDNIITIYSYFQATRLTKSCVEMHPVHYLYHSCFCTV